MNKNQIKKIAAAVAPDVFMAYRHHCEKSKYKDAKRLAIVNQFSLTKEQKEQIDDLYVTNYGKRIDYVWHQDYAAHSGKFDYRYFVELAYVPEFETFENQNCGANLIVEDKNFLPLIAATVGVETPKTILSCTNGFLRDSEGMAITPNMAKEIILRQGDCFVKPTVGSSSGEGCSIIKADANVDFSHNTLIIKGINGGGWRHNFVVQQLIECHDSIRALYEGSVNSFRVITYLWKGEIEVMPMIIRIGQGGHFLDNAHQGGMFCAVNEDGTMGDHAVTEFNKQYKEHPDTKCVFASHKIEHVDKVLSAAKKMHLAVPQIGVVNWDFTIDKNGKPLLIEANCNYGSVWLPQMAHGVGAFGNKTAEILQWLRFMKKLKPDDRKKFVGGYME